MRLGPALAVAVLALAGCGGGDDEESAATTAETVAIGTTSAGCESVEAPAAKEDGGQEAPSDELDGGKTYRLVVETNCGAFVITLDQEQSPKTAASLVALAENGFFDGLTFHRIVPGFVIQGGDPTGTGSGGPGYSTVDTPPSDARYTHGVVAMAKTAAEAPGTSGSQFFVVTGDDVGLPPEYAIVGEVTEGIDVIDLIGEQGGQDELPVQPIVIERVTVEET
jgi:cyclophilin family peptidyl-prolyl cis-trans isomerase